MTLPIVKPIRNRPFGDRRHVPVPTILGLRIRNIRGVLAHLRLLPSCPRRRTREFAACQSN
jgi:hypothetical protein